MRCSWPRSRLSASRSKGDKIAAYFDKSRFANPAPDTFGTLGRNALIGPGYWRTDASLFKRFALVSGHAVEFRIEAVNLFNHVNLANPDSEIGVPGNLNPNGFKIIFVNSIISNEWIGEGDDLPGVRGIGQYLLVAGHPGIEDDFTEGNSLRASRFTLKARSILKAE